MPNIRLVVILSCWIQLLRRHFYFFFNDTATTEIYTLSLHDALPICRKGQQLAHGLVLQGKAVGKKDVRSEEHTSELQSHSDLVCRLLLEKKKMPLWSKRAFPNRFHSFLMLRE